MTSLSDILEALVDAIEEVEPGGGPALLAVLSDEAVLELAKANWPRDPQALKETMRYLVAATTPPASALPADEGLPH